MCVSYERFFRKLCSTTGLELDASLQRAPGVILGLDPDPGQKIVEIAARLCLKLRVRCWIVDYSARKKR